MTKKEPRAVKFETARPPDHAANWAIYKYTRIIFRTEFCDWFLNSENKIPNFYE